VNTQKHQNPSLLFFRSTPSALANRTPLASSVQSFESCLCLLALQRYPPALVTCTSALESALQARVGEDGRRRLQALLAHAREEYPALTVIPQVQLDELRKLRNRFVHVGFGSGDDTAAAAALLLTGVPFLMSVYEVVFGFNLCDVLIPPFGAQLTVAIDVFRRQQPKHDGAVAALSVLGHLIRWSFRESMMAPWESEALDPTESYDLQLDIMIRLREQAERQLEPSWRFDCPICHGPETLIGKLNEELLEQKRIELQACFCAECGLRLSGAAGQLLNAICSEAITGYQEEILADFGIE
jgi:hypothetical protein